MCQISNAPSPHSVARLGLHSKRSYGWVAPIFHTFYCPSLAARYAQHCVLHADCVVRTDDTIVVAAAPIENNCEASGLGVESGRPKNVLAKFTIFQRIRHPYRLRNEMIPRRKHLSGQYNSGHSAPPIANEAKRNRIEYLAKPSSISPLLDTITIAQIARSLEAPRDCKSALVDANLSSALRSLLTSLRRKFKPSVGGLQSR